MSRVDESDAIQAGSRFIFALQPLDHVKGEIKTEDDIELLIDAFYAKVLKHPTLSYFFLNPSKTGLSTSSILSDTGLHRFFLPTHMRVHRCTHFEEWSRLWQETVEQLFFGEKAEFAILSGQNMAKNIYLKMFFNRMPTS